MRISRVLRDVAVPTALEKRTIDILTSEVASPDVERSAGVTPAAFALSRRSLWLRFVAAASIFVVLGIGIWGYVEYTRPTLTLDQIIAEMSSIEDKDWAELPVFEGDAALTTLPGEVWENGPMWLGRPPRGLPPNAPPQTMALYSFRAGLDRNQSVSGMLVIVFRRTLAVPPEAEGMASAPIYYYMAEGRSYSLVAWTAGDLVYVCGVEGGADDMEALQRACEGPSA